MHFINLKVENNFMMLEISIVILGEMVTGGIHEKGLQGSSNVE